LTSVRPRFENYWPFLTTIYHHTPGAQDPNGTASDSNAWIKQLRVLRAFRLFRLFGKMGQVKVAQMTRILQFYHNNSERRRESRVATVASPPGSIRNFVQALRSQQTAALQRCTYQSLWN
jgi:hypothetical protein